MKILHVPHAYAPVLGGTETQIRRVSECLAQQGHDVHVFTTDVACVDAYYAPMQPVLAPQHEVMNGVEVFRIPYMAALSRLFWEVSDAIPFEKLRWKLKFLAMSWCDRRFTVALARHIRSWKPDVVVALPHLLKNVQSVLRIRESLSFPLVLAPLLHEADPHFSTAATAAALTWADAVLANTQYEKGRLISKFLVPPNRVFVGGMGADVGRISNAKDKSPYTVTFIGRKTLTKGIPLLLKAMKLVWQDAPQAKLVLAGPPTPDQSLIEREIRAFPASRRSNIEMHDGVSEAEKIELLARTDLLVLPSAIESFGGVILEAWAARVPVLVLDTPVMRCIVDEGENGFLAPASERALADRILSGSRDRSRLRKMGDAGFRKVESQYNWKSTSGNFLRAYEFAMRNAGHRECRQTPLQTAREA